MLNYSNNTQKRIDLKYSIYTVVKVQISTILIAFLLAFSLSSSNLHAQFSDDFSSGSLSTNGWKGDTSVFVVNAMEELQLLNISPESQNQSDLFVTFNTGDSTQWSFKFRYDFSPSASNYTLFVLSSEGSDFDNFNGYYLKLGGISGSDDAIELFRKDGNLSSLLIGGTIGTLSGSTVEATVRCTKNIDGNWTLEMDKSGGTNFELQGTAQDNTYKVGSHLGVSCIYSSSRADKIFFDDITVGPEYFDDDAPIISSFGILADNSIQLEFNETLDSSFAIMESNYILTPAINLSAVSIIGQDNKTVELNYADFFEDGQSYSLQVKNVQDIAGNAISDTLLNFDFLKISPAEPFDLLITEIMADPNPAVGLPEVEFVELYNNSDKNISLSELSISDGSTEVMLEDFVLRKGEYVLLYESAPGISFESLSNALALPDFPSLSNDGDQVTIFNSIGAIIHSVHYSKDWYRNSDRDDGGYTLELIDANSPCLLSENWMASISNLGGTPGAQNSVFNQEIPQEDLSIISLFPNGSNSLLVGFNRALSQNLGNTPEFFSINGLNTTFVLTRSEQYDFFEVGFDTDFETNSIYEFCLNREATDCEENQIVESLCQKFGLPVIPAEGDIFINEILFNPLSGGSDFVELINTSNSIFDLGDLFLANIDTNGNPTQINRISDGFLFFPGDYIALTESPSYILSQYEVTNPQHLIEMDVPTYDDKEGSVVLLYNSFPDELQLDWVDYSRDWHNPLLDITDGVSIERISTFEDSNNPDNWRSASQTVGFATPTGPNSQQQGMAVPGDSPFNFPQKRLSPDDDGFEDFLSINYAEQENDFLLNIRVYDISGRLVKVLANNYAAGKEAFFRWDGENEEGDKARMGIYILWMERFTGSGLVERFKENIVLAEKLN